MTTPIADRKTFPPWTIIVLQVMWLGAAYFFVVDALAWRSILHFFMAGLSVFVAIALFLRWRLGFWLSSLAYAAGTGGDVARIIANETIPVPVAIGVVIGIGVVVIHQVAPSFRWFEFENVRKVRRWFWFLCALVCIVTEYGFRIFLPNAR
jgi:hypothetical protein